MFQKQVRSAKTEEVRLDVSASMDLEASSINLYEVKLIFEFKIDGMTCVNCSQAIENAMRQEFSKGGLLDVQIAVLTHKMRLTFDEALYKKHKLTTDKIIEEVVAIGFGAELLETIIDDSKRLREQMQSCSDLQSQASFRRDGGRSVIKNCTLIIDGMTCVACQNTIENHLRSLDGIVSASVSLLTHKANIQFQEKTIGIRNIIQEVEALGFSAKYEQKADKADIRSIVNHSVKMYFRRFFICLALQIPILILMWIIPYTAPEFLTIKNKVNGVPLFVWLNAAFATIIQIYIGKNFYISAYKSLRHKSANMDVLIVLGTTAAWGYGIALIGVGYKFTDGGEMGDSGHGGVSADMMEYRMQIQEHTHMFEISSVLITTILLGKYLETISKKKTVDKLAQLASLKVTVANLIECDKDERLSLDLPDKITEVELLQIGDLVKVFPGAGVPVDGVVLFGKGIANEAMLTGESRPVHKDIGATVFGGSILIQGNIIMKVTKTAENSSLNQIIKLVENAQNAKAPIQGLADNIAKVFVPIVILLSAITWISWFAYAFSPRGYERIDLKGMTRFQFAFSFGIATLVIACPCALGLATPTAVMVGTGVAASFGVLIKGGDILEKTSNITTIVFDKTGTLTSGQPQVKDLISIKEHFKYAEAMENKDLLFFFTYLLEKASEHPLAKAVVKKIESLIPSKIEEFKDRYIVKEFKNREGEGVVSTIIDNQNQDSFQVLCGNDRLANAFNVRVEEELKKNIDLLEQEGNTVIQMIVNGVPQLIISLEEAHTAKFESRDVVNYLRNTMKLRIAMITGDNQHAAYKVARYLGIDTKDVVYKAYPEDKKKTVERFQQEGEKVMFVGDGINDSPVLAQADVGVAINSASDITVNAASIVLMKDNLYDVVNALRISKKSFVRIKINFVWAFVYNMLLVPIAMGVLYPVNSFKFDPMYAGGAMAASSISVVLSSLILKFFKPIDKVKNSQTSQGDDAKPKKPKKVTSGTDTSLTTVQTDGTN